MLWTCEACNDLLGAYKRAVRLYKDAELGCRGLLGDDLRLALKELERLRLACRNADEALLSHLRQDHRDFAKKSGSS